MSTNPRQRPMSCIVQDGGDFSLLDWMVFSFPVRSREQWKRTILEQRVWLNSKVADISTRVQTGDLLVTYRDGVPEPEVPLDIPILREEEDWVIINKPAGLPVHPGGVFYEHTLWFQAKKQWPELVLINRLDRETSGCMILSKNKLGNRYWHGLIRDNRVKKDYLAVVKGRVHFPTNQWTSLSGVLVPDTKSGIRKKLEFIPDEEAGSIPFENKIPCQTLVQSLEDWGSYTLLKMRLLTGKTHQIRATMLALGYPLIGDKMYGANPELYLKWIRRELNDSEKKSLVIDRQALHSWGLEWKDQGGELQTVQADLPQDLAGLRMNGGSVE